MWLAVVWFTTPVVANRFPLPSVAISNHKFQKDPAGKRWVRNTFIFLLLSMPPVWAPPGYFLGIPVWAVSALFVSVITSGFITYIILQVWNEPEEKEKNDLPENCKPK